MKTKILTLSLLLLTYGAVLAQWQSNGSAIYYNNGNVGIGTSNPQWGKLQINAPTENDAALRLESGRFSMGGNARFEIDANGVVGGRFKVAENGNVGIGTTDPQQLLHVAGGNFNNGIKIEGDNTGLFIEDTGANPSEFKIYNNEGLGIWQENGTAGAGNRFFISQANGNIGIGTTNPQWGKLQINTPTEDDAALRLESGRFSMGGNARFEIDANGVVGGRFKVAENGNVGIGTANPNANLDVSGIAHFSGSASPSTPIEGAYIGWNGFPGTAGEMDFINHKGTGTGGFAFYNTDGNGSVKTLQMRIDGSGKVGIGTANPNANLDVSGIAHFSGSASPSTPIEGAYIGWNALTGGTGETNFINHKGLGTGGFAFYNTDGNGSVKTLQMRIDGNGNVGIGTTSPDEKLTVKGKIHTQEVRVDLLGAVAPDFVFEPTYNLRSLAETERYIKEHKHLPEIPSAAEMETTGMELKAMNLKLLQKVEELTLYAIEQQKLIQEMRTELDLLKNK